MRKAAATAAIMMVLWAVTGVAQAAPTKAPPLQWRVAYRTQSATAGPLSSVTAAARNDAWAVGTSGTGRSAMPLILHWHGASWRPVSIPGTAAFTPQLVTSTSPDDVWVLGAAGKQSLAWTYNGTTWKKNVLPAPFGGGVFGAVSGHDAWGSAIIACITVGPGPTTTTCTSNLWHWNGARWSSHGLDGFLDDIVVAGGHAWFVDLTSVQAVASNHPNGLPVIYEATGSTVKKVSTPAATRVSADSAVAVSPGGQVWVLARLATAKRSGALLHWTGKRWTQIAIPARADGEPLVVQNVLAYDGGSGVWAGPFAHWTGQRWVNANPGRKLADGDAYSLSAIAPIPGTAILWAVGWVARTPTDNTHDTLIARYGS